MWVSNATVAVVGDDGEPDFEDPHSVHIGPQGVSVDVILDPGGMPMTCRYNGLAGGQAGSIQYPVQPGDEVVVLIPSGEMGGAPIALPAFSSAWAPLPLGPDRKPLFNNDRIHVYAKNVPIDIRTAGGARILVNQDGTVEASGEQVTLTTDKVRLGAANAVEQLLKGTTYRSAESQMNIGVGGLQATYTSMAALCVGPLAPLAAGFTALAAAIGAFEAQASSFLSDVSKTK
jgi:hypothetical protein